MPRVPYQKRGRLGERAQGMPLILEPVPDEEDVARVRATGVQLLGIESTRRRGAWPTLRHVFDLGDDAGLHVEINPLGACEAYAVGYSLAGDELLRAL